MCEQTEQAVVNTVKTIWREDVSDRPGDSIFVTEGGGIGIQCGGHCVVMKVREWFKLAGSVPVLIPKQ